MNKQNNAPGPGKSRHTARPDYYLGLPAWAFPGWTGSYFPPATAAAPTLQHYARVFNTVEGNTTFYRVPEAQTVRAWSHAVAAAESGEGSGLGTGFRFSFKLPQTVTHQRQPDWADLERFMSVLEPLGANLGPFLVQCPASLGPADLPRLEALFQRLPREHHYALELRHLDFFSTPGLVEPLLERHNAARVMFDSRPIYQGDRAHPEVLAARHKKPEVPLLDEVYNGLAYARVVLHPDPRYNGPFIADWLDRTSAYLAAGHTVYFMMHCPNNQHCPGLAESFHNALRARAEVTLPGLSPWPLPRQESLF